MDADVRDRIAKLITEHIANGHTESEREAIVRRLLGVLEDNPATLTEITCTPSDDEREELLRQKEQNRWDHRLISQHIPEEASVLDLGAGNGELLAHLMETKRVRAQGIELDSEAVMACVANGVPVFQADVDEGLVWFPDGSFDYVVLEETVQTLHQPRTVLREMVRVGRRGIVSFPNFGFWKVRLSLALGGHMPVTAAWPYEWHDSPNIHPLSLDDFTELLVRESIRIVDGHVWDNGASRALAPDDNLFAEEVMLIVE